ncbi:MAG: HD domain-containing phosphohydrolase [Candidatus Acidiferrales bacterium]
MTGVVEKLSQRVARLGPRRIRLLYLILGVLLTVSVIPLIIYGYQVSSSNREALETTEKLYQTTVTRDIAQEIRLYVRGMNLQTENLVRLLESSGAIGNVAEPRHATTLGGAAEAFIRGTEERVLYLNIVNTDQRGIYAGNPEVIQDEFVRQRLNDAFQAAQLGHSYNSGAFLIQSQGKTRPVMMMARPLAAGNDFSGMVATVMSLDFLAARLQDASQNKLVTYVVDRSGRLIVHAEENERPGQDMNDIEIVQRFREGSGQATITTTFTLEAGGRKTRMLGTYAVVPELDWGVIAQKRLDDAYYMAWKMELNALVLALITIAVSVLIGYISARRLTAPLQVLAETTRAIAKGDFTRRVRLPSRTEIGELAETFNLMSDDLEKFVEQLKQAAQENHELFMGSIRTLAAAIDEKDPYTRGHSGRVAKYSVVLAETLGLPDEEVYKIRISALLHDVGKIGVDDRVLKKPGGLTTEEFEVMKQHPVKGANIIRPVAKLREMIPGIELHHESLDGHGYPYGLKGEEIPVMARVIAVADTLDAMTTNRPYQAAMDLGASMEKIRSLQVKKFDPVVVDALFKSVETGRLRISPQMVEV